MAIRLQGPEMGSTSGKHLITGVLLRESLLAVVKHKISKEKSVSQLQGVTQLKEKVFKIY